MILAGMGAASGQSPLQGQIVAVVRRFNGLRFTPAAIMPTLQAARAMAADQVSRGWKLAAEYSAALPQQLYTDVRNNLRQLDYLIGLMRKQVSSTYAYRNPDKVWKDVRDAVIAPLQWQENVQQATGLIDKASAQLVDDVLNGLAHVPSTVVGAAAGYVAGELKAAVTQALAPLAPSGIPGWVVPAVLGTVGVGVAAYAWRSFRGRVA